MSFYTSAVKSHQIDPVFDRNKFRSEFRLDEDKLYLTNLRIANVGVVHTGIEPKSYKFFTGAYGIIKDIQLMDGGKVIDEVREFQKYIAFKNYNASNDDNKSKNKFLNRSNYSFKIVDGNPAVGTDPDNPTLASTRPIKYAVDNIFGSVVNPNSDTDLGWLSLKEVFGFLSEATVLSTSLMKNLRVVINYDKTDVLGGGVLGANDSSSMPTLLADEVVDETVKNQLIKTITSMTFQCIEHDRVIVPQVAPTAENTEVVQKTNFRVNGFNGKVLGRLLIVNSPTTQTGLDLFKHGSVNQINQVVQVRVNGTNRLPFNGISGPNERLQLMAETWGQSNVIPGMANGAANIDVYDKTPGFKNIIGSQDYFGMRIGDIVEDLQLEYTRTGVFDEGAATQGVTRYNQQLNLDIFAEVTKTLSVSGNNYELTYNGTMM